ncbi:hypothetical protein HPB52_016468 [Rhipicephalus sanguineus]|uniref:Uncharacterized protein n=1 Tax=Rhipicephalus sanguineus TaxID=34632 RepID=A0A9D4PWR3_RHISA|nr:hypothetical protein HPB52_016468 [Rhipicephalus sanguineus]
MDVCPNPQDKICRGCGIANPGEDHKCEPNVACAGGNISPPTGPARRDSKRLTSSVGGAGNGAGRKKTTRTEIKAKEALKNDPNVAPLRSGAGPRAGP